jgi:hypothetical protein
MEMLERELQQEQLYGSLHERSKWDKWLTTLASEELQREIALGEKAHQLLKAISDEKWERPPNWRKLFRKDRKLRREAIPAIGEAVEALRAAQKNTP